MAHRLFWIVGTDRRRDDRRLLYRAPLRSECRRSLPPQRSLRIRSRREFPGGRGARIGDRRSAAGTGAAAAALAVRLRLVCGILGSGCGLCAADAACVLGRSRLDWRRNMIGTETPLDTVLFYVH